MPWIHFAPACPGSRSSASVTASRPRSDAAAPARGSSHQGLLTMLASARDHKERIEIAWIASKPGKKPFLSLGAEVGAQLSLKDCLGPRETVVDAKLGIRCDAGAAARFLQEQRIKHPRDLADC